MRTRMSERDARPDGAAVGVPIGVVRRGLRFAVPVLTVCAMTAGSVVLASPASAAQTTVSDFAELRAAVQASTEEIILSQDITVTATLAVPQGATVTIDGNGHALTRDAAFTSGSLVQANLPGSGLSIQNLTVDGAGVEAVNPLMRVLAAGNTFTASDSTFENAVVTAPSPFASMSTYWYFGLPPVSAILRCPFQWCALSAPPCASR